MNERKPFRSMLTGRLQRELLPEVPDLLILLAQTVVHHACHCLKLRQLEVERNVRPAGPAVFRLRLERCLPGLERLRLDRPLPGHGGLLELRRHRTLQKRSRNAFQERNAEKKRTCDDGSTIPWVFHCIIDRSRPPAEMTRVSSARKLRTRVSLQLQWGLSIGIAAVSHDSPNVVDERRVAGEGTVWGLQAAATAVKGSERR